ncbi:MAG: ABC transporter permease [Acidimicrobiia bacterium]|nr:ABC transporter permease [Acidimicrobiia bacterium]
MTASAPPLTRSASNLNSYVARNAKALAGLGVVVVALIVAYRWDGTQTTAVMARTVREAAPLILAALCGLVGERSGIINIGIEGQLLLSAFCGFMVGSYSGSIILAVVAALAVAGLAGTFLAWTSIRLRMDQIIAGTVINIFAIGATSFFYVPNRTMATIPTVSLGFLSDVPLVGPMLFDHGPLTYAALVAVAVVHVALFETRWGLRTRAVGEHPSAADTVGVDIFRLRYLNLTLAGMLAGLGGMALIQSAGVFNRGMSNGKGFIALAVMLIGRYRPTGVLAAALLFGFFNALQAQLQFKQVFDIPPQFFGMIPFVLTIAVLAIAGISVRPPAAVGKHYEKE